MANVVFESLNHDLYVLTVTTLVSYCECCGRVFKEEMSDDYDDWGEIVYLTEELKIDKAKEITDILNNTIKLQKGKRKELYLYNLYEAGDIEKRRWF